MKAYTFTQGASGGNTRVLAESVPVWAHIVNTSGSVQSSFAQQIWQINLKVTIRYQAKFDSNWVFEYAGQEYKISDISPKDEGYKRFLVIRSSTSEKIESWS